MKPYLHLIDRETTGPRYDVTPLFANREGFAALVDDIVRPFRAEEIGLVACIDALGFLLGAAAARALGAGVLAVRKGGKLPAETIGRTFTDYTGSEKRLEIRKDAPVEGARILLVDEWVETGAQVRAAADLIESAGGVLAAIATIRLDRNEKTGAIRERYAVHEVWPEESTTG